MTDQHKIDLALQAAKTAKDGELQKAFVGAMESLSETASSLAGDYHATLRGDDSYGGPNVEYVSCDDPADLSGLYEEVREMHEEVEFVVENATTSEDDIAHVCEVYERLSVKARSAALRAHHLDQDIPVWVGSTNTSPVMA